MGTDDVRYLTPRRGVPWQAVEDAVTALGGTAADTPEDGTDFAWSVPGATVRLFDDAALHVPQLEVAGPRHAQVADALAVSVPVYEVADLPGLVADAPGLVELRWALGVLGAVAPPEARPDLVALFEQGLRHEDPDVRAAAVVAATVPRWPELRRALEPLADDEDEDVAELVASVLERYPAP